MRSGIFLPKFLKTNPSSLIFQGFWVKIFLSILTPYLAIIVLCYGGGIPRREGGGNIGPPCDTVQMGIHFRIF